MSVEDGCRMMVGVLVSSFGVRRPSIDDCELFVCFSLKWPMMGCCGSIRPLNDVKVKGRIESG